MPELKLDLESLTLIPSRGGCYEVWIDDDRIYSKLATGEFPDDNTLLAEIRQRFAAST